LAQVPSLRQVVWNMPGWQMYLSQLHEAAGVEWPNDDLIDCALHDLEADIRGVVSTLPESQVSKRYVLRNFREGKENASATAGIDTEASMAG